MNWKQRFLTYLAPQKKRIIILAFSVILFLSAQLSQPLLVGLALDSAIANNSELFFTYIFITLGLSITGSFADFFFEYHVGVMTQEMIFSMRNDVFKKMNQISIKQLYDSAIGQLVQLEIGDVENVATGLFSVFKSLIEGVLAITITILMMFLTNWILALGVIILSPLSLMVSRFVAKFSHKYFKKQAKLQSSLNAISLEAINNADLLQSLNAQDDSYTEFVNRDEELRKEGKIALFSASWTNPTTRLVNNTIYTVIGIVGIVLILFTPSVPLLNMSIGRLSSFLSYTTSYTKPFNEISSVLSEYETSVFSFERIHNFLSSAEDVDLGKENVTDIKEIRFDNLYFSYDKEKRLIEDFNEVIHKGDRVAIVGPTGAGKSTIINLLMRFYDPDNGSILYNGIKGEDINKASLRSNFGMVLQETWIFSGTVMENVRYAKPDATDEEVILACKKAHADTFINTLPHGYQTLVSAKEGLSEGERQMLTIARVMLKKPDIVILDEATSNVDTRSEKLISSAFDEMMKNRTSIVIAHRLSTIKEADLILVLQDGHVIETGTHPSLMEKKGFYYSLYSSQFQ